MFNGTAEAAIDSYARAFHLAKADSKTPKAYTDSLLKSMQDLYNVRFNKPDGFDAFIAQVDKKPMPNPLMPVTPISDPEPVATPADATTTTPATPGTTPAKPGTTPVKPGTTTTTTAKPPVTVIKPTTTPVKNPGTKPQALLKKPVVKKKGA